MFWLNIPFARQKPYTSVYLVILGLVSGPYTKVNRISTFDSEYSADVSSVGLVKYPNSWLIWPKPLRLMIITDQTIWSFRAHLVWSLMFKLLIYFANYDFCQVILVNDFLPLASEKNVGVLVHVHVHLYVCGTTRIMFSFPRIYTYKLFSPSVTLTNS